MSAIPLSIEFLRDGRLEIAYSGGRTICVYFSLKLPCLFVRSITATFKKLLPAAEFKDFISELISLFESKAGPMF